jgi:hypothetical protein
MLPEEQVAPEDRWLMLTGLASAKAVRAVEGGLPQTWPATARCVFVSYAYADLPLGKTFEAVFPVDRPDAAVDAAARIIGVTQQYGTAWTSVPHGWKTVCVLDFPRGVPAIVDALPTVDVREGGERAVGVSSRATLEARLAKVRG